LDRTVARLLDLTSKVAESGRSREPADLGAHHALAREIAEESIVLLKNEGGFLPLKPEGTIAFIGEFARKPRFQGGGSSHIQPTRVDDPYGEAGRLGGFRLTYAPGYSAASDGSDPALIEEARRVAAATDRIESEGYDRTSLDLPEAHRALIDAVTSVNPNAAVVLINGAPVAMPWLDRVPAVLEAYLGGQAAGGAIVDTLFGRVNPSGHLAETFPARLEDSPAYPWYPGGREKAEYREGVYVGYRYYRAKRLRPLFPFGHGLSYTTFGFSNLRAPSGRIDGTKDVSISVDVTNEGKVPGKIAVQLYVRDRESSVHRLERELRAFEKVSLEPHETKTVRFVLDPRAWSFWDEGQSGWRFESGIFDVMAGASSEDIRLEAALDVHNPSAGIPFPDMHSTLADFRAYPAGRRLADTLAKPFLDSLGKLEPASAEARMAASKTEEMPLRAFLNCSGDRASRELAELTKAVIRGERPEADLEGKFGGA